MQKYLRYFVLNFFIFHSINAQEFMGFDSSKKKSKKVRDSSNKGSGTKRIQNLVLDSWIISASYARAFYQYSFSSLDGNSDSSTYSNQFSMEVRKTLNKLYSISFAVNYSKFEFTNLPTTISPSSLNGTILENHINFLYKYQNQRDLIIGIHYENFDIDSSSPVHLTNYKAFGLNFGHRSSFQNKLEATFLLTPIFSYSESPVESGDHKFTVSGSFELQYKYSIKRSFDISPFLKSKYKISKFSGTSTRQTTDAQRTDFVNSLGVNFLYRF